MQRMGVVFAGLGNMGQGSNTLLDASGFGNHGTLTNMAIPATATSGWDYDPTLGRPKLKLAGTSQYVALTRAISPCLPTGHFSIGMFINPTNIANSWYLCGERETVTDPDQGFAFAFYGATAGDPLSVTQWGQWGQDSSASGIVAGIWQHVAVTYDRIKLRFYRNGIEISNHAKTTAMVPCPGRPCFIGDVNNVGSPAASFIGGMSDVIIAKEAWNVPIIQALADPSNVMLRVGGVSMLLDPKRRLFRAFPSGGGAPAGFKPYWIPQRNRMIGATL